MADGWWERARDDVADDDAGSHLGPVTVGVLHTTESPVGRYRPGSGSNYGNFGHTSFPHFTVDVQDGEFVAFQHISIRRCAKALKNRALGVETNREGCIQIEVVGRAVEPFTSREVLVDGLRELMRWIESETSIPRYSGVAWLSYPDSAGDSPVRLSHADWTRYRGWLGHQHVPENDHGDPGAIDIKKLLWVEPAAPAPQEDDVYAVISDPKGGPDYGTNGVQKFPFGSQKAKSEWAKAFKAERLTLTTEAFNAIPTVTTGASR